MASGIFIRDDKNKNRHFIDAKDKVCRPCILTVYANYYLNDAFSRNNDSLETLSPVKLFYNINDKANLASAFLKLFEQV